MRMCIEKRPNGRREMRSASGMRREGSFAPLLGDAGCCASLPVGFILLFLKYILSTALPMSAATLVCDIWLRAIGSPA
jgi:hypothetical protein